jgi:hypothetical protein
MVALAQRQMNGATEDLVSVQQRFLPLVAEQNAPLGAHRSQTIGLITACVFLFLIEEY